MMTDDPQQGSDLIGRSQSHMIGCLYPLGTSLAERRVGPPFDPIALNIGLGPNRDTSRACLRRLIGELQAWEVKLALSLPSNYSRSVAVTTLRNLGGP
jgi:hypothetical protein